MSPRYCSKAPNRATAIACFQNGIAESANNERTTLRTVGSASTMRIAPMPSGSCNCGDLVVKVSKLTIADPAPL